MLPVDGGCALELVICVERVDIAASPQGSVTKLAPFQTPPLCPRSHFKLTVMSLFVKLTNVSLVKKQHDGSIDS